MLTVGPRLIVRGGSICGRNITADVSLCNNTFKKSIHYHASVLERQAPQMRHEAFYDLLRRNFVLHSSRSVLRNNLACRQTGELVAYQILCGSKLWSNRCYP
ncbi:BEL1-like homeodomain containing hypothetical protein [Phytophthora palmivora]|uniref:Uncharacterized protein n=1 Tax=Phytophthora palmivora TaxID=4796 RepID=A0A2P4YRQ0_9STRA|nr:BEL1-like homeodomain containing hypothetical protein [Phytophthora palmivora]